MPAPVDGHSNRFPAQSYLHAFSDPALRDYLPHSPLVPADSHLFRDSAYSYRHLPISRTSALPTYN